MDLRGLRKIAKTHGWSVEQTRRRGHWLFRNPQGRVVATAADTASDYRSIQNTASALRRAGLPVPHRGGRTSRERKSA